MAGGLENERIFRDGIEISGPSMNSTTFPPLTCVFLTGTSAAMDCGTDGLQEDHGSIPRENRYFPTPHRVQISSSGAFLHIVDPGAVPLGVKRTGV